MNNLELNQAYKNQLRSFIMFITLGSCVIGFMVFAFLFLPHKGSYVAIYTFSTEKAFIIVGIIISFPITVFLLLMAWYYIKINNKKQNGGVGKA